MAWSNQKTIGNWNSQERITVTLVSQNQSANTSTVDIVGDLYNGGTGTAVNQSGATWSLSGDVSKGNASFTFNVGPKKWGRVGSHRATISHAANGTKSAKITLNVGNTGTTTFGTPGAVTVSFTLPRIPKPSNAPSTPTVGNITSSGMRIAWNAPTNTNGAPITRYQVQRADNSAMTQGVGTAYTGTTRNYTNNALAANRTYYWRVRAENSAGWSGWSGVRSGKTAVNKPAGVTFGALTRVSDTSQNLTWTRNATTAAPYTQIQVDRRDTVNGNWTRIANLAGTATSYRDNTTVAGRRYDYRVRSSNAGGQSGWTATYGINTTPPTATAVKAVKTGNNINVSWTPQVVQYGVQNYRIQDNPGNTGWVTVATVGNVSAWSHVDPNPAVTHQYRVQVSVVLLNSSSSLLWSSWSDPSGVVQLLAPPLQPTLIAPTGAVDYTEPITFEWQHNPVDTTPQSAANLRYRLNGGAWVTLPIAGDQETLTLDPLDVMGSIDWQVQTRGDFPTFGDWSVVGSFDLAARPTVTFDFPENGSLIYTSEVAAIISFYAEDGGEQSAIEWKLLQDGNVLEQYTTSTQMQYRPFLTVLDDQTEYTITVRVLSSTGLWSQLEETTFVTAFPVPVTVEPIPIWDRDSGSVSLTFTEPDEAAVYAWEGEVNDSPSTRTTEGGELTNYVPDPFFENTDGTVEVWRNYILNPDSVGGTLIFANGATNAGSVSVLDHPAGVASAYQWSVSAANDRVYQLVSGYEPTPNSTYPFAIWVKAPLGASYGVRAMNLAGAVPYGDAVAVEGTGQWQMVQGSATIPGVQVGLRMEVRHTSGTVGDYQATLWTFGSPEPFSGSVSPDSDLTPSWTGPVNDSPSVLTGKTFKNYEAIGDNGVFIQSTQWSVSGGVSGRLIKTGSSSAAMASALVLGLPNNDSTALLTVRSVKEIVGGVVAVSGTGTSYLLEPEQSLDGPQSLSAVLDTSGAAQVVFGLDDTVPVGESLWVDSLALIGGAHPDIEPFSGSFQSTIDVDHLTVQRRIDGGDWVTLVTNLDPAGAIVDHIPLTNGLNEYRAISYSDIPTSATGPLVEFEIYEPDLVYFNWGPQFSTVLTVCGEPALAQLMSRESAVYPMAGRPYPKGVLGQNLSHEFTFTGVADRAREELALWEEFSKATTAITYRDYRGRRNFALLRGVGMTDNIVPEVDVEFTRIDYTENSVDFSQNGGEEVDS